MWKIIRKMFYNLIFVTVLYMVSYTNRDSNAILQVTHLRQFFLNTKNSTYDFTKIITVDDFWNWLEISFISNIRVQSWYNGDSVENMTDYLNDKSNRIIGWATMRQLRLRLNASCEIPSIMRKLFDSCKDSYSLLNEERDSFEPGWNLTNNATYSSSIENAFIYRSSAELDSYIYIGEFGTYGGGGYVYEFREGLSDLQENLAILRELSWIDEQTRAIMIQLNLYNPNVKFFTSVTLIVEFSEIGEVFSSSHIEPMQMYTDFNDFSSIFYLIIACIYMIFIIILTIAEIFSIYKIRKKYFYNIHSYVDWGIIICSWSGVGVHVWRYSEAKRIGNYFRQTNGFKYINLQFATYVNDILTFLLGFCCFFGTIRLLRLFDIYPRIYMFTQILNRAFKDILSFSLMFMLLFLAFVVLFHLLFVSKMWSCSTLIRTCAMLLEMILLAYDFSEMQNVDAFLGPFVCGLFVYFVVFICITMFVVIIQEHVRYVRAEINKKEHTYPNLFLFIIRDLIKRTGLKRLTDEELQEEYDTIMRTKYKNAVKQLPEKVDELFLTLQRMCMICTENEMMEILANTKRLSISTFNEQQTGRRRKHVIYST